MELQAFRKFLAFGTDHTQLDIWTGSLEHNMINHKIASASGLLLFPFVAFNLKTLNDSTA